MTIQVGHPHECPTFFCPPPQGEVNGSTGQRVNKLVSDRSDKSDSSDATKRISPLSPFFLPKFAPVVAYINHNIS